MFGAFLVTLQMIVAQLSLFLFSLISSLLLFRHVLLPPLPQQLKALEGVWGAGRVQERRGSSCHGYSSWVTVWHSCCQLRRPLCSGSFFLKMFCFNVPHRSPSLSINLFSFTHSFKRKCYNFPTQEMAFLWSVAMPTSSSCCFVEKREGWWPFLLSSSLQTFYYHPSVCIWFCPGLRFLFLSFICSSILFSFLYLNIGRGCCQPPPSPHPRGAQP